MSHKHANLMRSIFQDPPSANIHWREVESLLHHLGAPASGRASPRCRPPPRPSPSPSPTSTQVPSRQAASRGQSASMLHWPSPPPGHAAASTTIAITQNNGRIVAVR